MRRKQPLRVAMGMFSVVPARWQPRGWHLIWVEDGELFTTCVGCNRLIGRDDGPRCTNCRPSARSLQMARRQRKLEKLLERWQYDGPAWSLVREQGPWPRNLAGHWPMSVPAATRQAPEHCVHAAQGKAAFDLGPSSAMLDGYQDTTK